MVFNSLHFLIFLPAVIFLYFAIPYKWRWLLLLFVSYYFYMCWKAEYAFLIVLSTSIDYLCGLQMSKHEDKKKRKPWMILSIVMNLSILFLFKYFNFFNDSARVVFDSLNIFYNVPEFKLLLPVGLSFYTFQAISYTVDVYKGTAKAEKNFGFFATFVAYWPQLVAGPIQRKEDFLPQLKQNFDFDYERVKQGLIRILYGFFKKVVIADRLAIFVREVYNQPGDHGGFAVILATWLFAIQVYCDFSGYCDIAIGSSRIMGHNLRENFKTPYFAKSIREFWERWHITLTVWVRDYLYIPMGGSKVSFPRMLFNNLAALTIMGFWHGANWTFIMFGFVHGSFIVISRIWDRYFPKINLPTLLPKAKWLTNFLLMFWIFNLTCIPDIFFCSRNINESWIIIQSIFNHPDTTWALINSSSPAGSTPSVIDYWLSIFFVAILLYTDYNLYTHKDVTIEKRIAAKPVYLRWGFYILITVLVSWFAVTTDSVFIYFQF